MPRIAKELSAKQVERLKVTAAVGGVPGLMLQVVPPNARSWMLRFTVAGKRRWMGLGPFPTVPLAQARDAARKALALRYEGVDPLAERKAARSALAATTASQKTFRQCAEAFLDSKTVEFANAKHAAQWATTLETYAYPHIGNRIVRDIQVGDVLTILQPIWTTKTETASRLRGRIESVLAWATVSKYRTGDSPARWKGNLDALLPKPNKLKNVVHQPAVPVNEMPTFMSALSKAAGVAARALELAALTAARSGEVRLAVWSEFDLDAAVWSIPAERMKMRRPHRVPLSPAAVDLLKSMPRIEGTDVVFPGAKGQPLSDMSLSAVMRRMGVDAVPHGLRSSFRMWAAERTNHPGGIAEAALAHAVRGVEGDYQRSDLFDRRRSMMNDWAAFCRRIATPATVTPIRAESQASAARG